MGTDLGDGNRRLRSASTERRIYYRGASIDSGESPTLEFGFWETGLAWVSTILQPRRGLDRLTNPGDGRDVKRLRPWVFERPARAHPAAATARAAGRSAFTRPRPAASYYDHLGH